MRARKRAKILLLKKRRVIAKKQKRCSIPVRRLRREMPRVIGTLPRMQKIVPRAPVRSDASPARRHRTARLADGSPKTCAALRQSAQILFFMRPFSRPRQKRVVFIRFRRFEAAIGRVPALLAQILVALLLPQTLSEKRDRRQKPVAIPAIEARIPLPILLRRRLLL